MRSVDVASSGSLTVSVGGSGGNSSTIIDFSLDIGTPATEGVSAAASVAVGADGGDGGEAGAVTVANTKSIYTSSDLADGIKAQSDGGSAGSIYVIQASAGSTSRSADVALGGSGASGSLADTVDVENEGYIQTSGYRSRGIFAQSQGGSGGDGGSVTVGNSAGIKTSGIDADAIYAQSVGGDGGSGGTAAAYALDLTSPPPGRRSTSTSPLPWAVTVGRATIPTA